MFKIRELKGLFYRRLVERKEIEEEVLPGFKIRKPSRLIEFPEVKDITKVDITYALIEPFAYANIKWDPEKKGLVYNIIEPELTDKEKDILEKVSEGLIELIEVELTAIKNSLKGVEYLEKNVLKVIKEFGLSLTPGQYVRIMYYIYRNFVGYNEIEAFLQDPHIEDISCDGVGIPLYVIHRKFGSLKTNVMFERLEDLRDFVVKLAERCGRYVSYAEPILSGTLPDGSRVSATLAGDVATRGPIFTLRKFGENPFSPIEQIELGTASSEVLAYFWYLVEHGASMLIIGGTATGKCIAPSDRVQLANGEIAKIEEIYNKILESNPKPKIELFTLTPNLDVPSIRINKFWKWKSTPIVVNIKTESGCTVTTTPEHEFLCMKEGRIERIRSDRLKNGDYLLSLRKIDIEGKTQTLKLSDWATEKIYISEPKSLVAKILSKAVEKYGSIASLARYLKLKYKRVECWQKGKSSIPFHIFKKLCDDLGIEFKGVERKIEKVKSKTSSCQFSLVRKTSEELLRLVGYIIGDGGIYESGVQFFNSSRELREDFAKIVRHLGLSCREEFPRNRTPKVVIGNKTFGIFLMRTFGIQKGKKSGRVEVPKVVEKCPDNEVREFIKGLFDSEGSVSKKECEIEFSTSSKALAYDLSALMRRFKIVARIRTKKYKGKIYYRVIISGKKDLELFRKEIGFVSKKNQKSLCQIIKKTRKYHTNVDVIPVGAVIREIIEKNNLHVSEVAREAAISRRALGFIIAGKRNPSFYLLNKIVKGLENSVNPEDIFYLKKLCKSDLFFDRVKKVEKKICNEEFVYDLTVDGTHNFLAGNGGGLIISNTSFLNSICMFIQPEAKIVSIEDTREIKIPHEHWIPGLARVGFGIPMPTGEKYGGVSLFDLLKESFRQNPDYVVVGETRGPEAYVMFQGMASIPAWEKVAILNDNILRRVRISELKEDKNYLTFTIDPVEEKVKILPIKAKIEHQPRKVLYRIKTKSGREITTTPDHSVFTYEKGIKPIRVNQLSINDKIVVPAKIPCGYNDIDYLNLIELLPDIRVFAPKPIKKAVEVLGFEKASRICGIKSISDYYANFKRGKPSALLASKFIKLMEEAKIRFNLEDLYVRFVKKSKGFPANFKITPEFLRLLGYYVSEGSLNESGRNNRISLYNQNMKILEDMRHCIKAVTNSKIRERNKRGYSWALELSFSHKVLFEFLKRFCGKSSRERKIPDFIFGLSKEKIGEFLTAVYAGDGSYFKRMEGGYVFSYSTKSKQLADDMVHLLLTFGIIGRCKKDKEMYYINVYRRKEQEVFLKFVRPMKKEIEFEKIGKESWRKRNDIYIDEIKSLEKIELEEPVPVFDLSVPKTENFIGGFGGVMLHNSGHSSLSTFHAGSLDTVIKRLTSPPIELSPTLIESLDVVITMIHAREKGKSARRIKEIVEIEAVDPKTHEIRTKTIFLWNPAQDSFEAVEESVKLKKIVAAKGGKIEDALKEIERRRKVLDWLRKKGIKDYLEVTKYINSYYKEPGKLMKIIGEEVEVKVPAKVEKERPKRFSSVLELFKLIKGRT